MSKTAELEDFLVNLTQEQASELQEALRGGTLNEHLENLNLSIADCDGTEIIKMLRRRFAAVSDEDLALIAGGEIKVTAAVVGVSTAAVASLAAAAIGIGAASQ
jgi:hypothetical protein